MDPNNIYRTDINQGSVNFTDPLNIAHLYPGWGNNPNYQTPSYDAPYRPAYTGPNPYASYGRQGFMQSLNQLYMPGYKDPYWGNPVDNNRGAAAAVSGRPADFMAHLGQNYIVPIASMWAANRLLSGVGSNIGAGLFGGAIRGIGLGGVDTALGGVAGGALNAGARLFGAEGSTLGASLASRGLLGSFGGLVGRVAVPVMAGLAASNLADAAVFQPYIRSRQMAETLQDSFSGITFGAGYGNPVSGRGLSGRNAASMAGQIDRAGIQDMTFSANQYHGIAGMGMRAGLFDDVGAGDIVKRVGSIAAQVKMILAISKDPSIQNAIEELSKLRLGGASVNGGVSSVAASSYSAIGMHASAAGASVQRLMNTVGGQGQYMYQMNGITPYLGQIAAASAFSGFASAQRMGLMSTAEIARMGGVEGLTQSSLAAQIAGGATPYNRMRMYNQYIGSGGVEGTVNTVRAFGSHVAGNPLRAMGEMILNEPAMRSAQDIAEGSRNTEKQALDIMRAQSITPGRGGFDPRDMAAILQGTMGMTPEQTRAYIKQRQAETNPGLVSQNLKAYRAQNREQILQARIQEGMQDTFINNYIQQPATRAWKRFKEEAASSWAYNVGEIVGEVQDSVLSGWYKYFQGGREGDFQEDRRTNLNLSKLGPVVGGGSNIDAGKVLRKIHSSIKSKGRGYELAVKLLETGFEGKDSKALFSKFLEAQGDGESINMLKALDRSPDLYHSTAALAKRPGVIEKIANNPALDSSALDSITGVKASSFDNLKLLGQAAEVYSSPGSLGVNLDDLLSQPKYSELANYLKGVSGTENKIDKMRSMFRASLDSGYAQAARIASSMAATPEQVMADPNSFSSDPGIRKAIREAGGDKAKIKAIMQLEIARRNNGSLVGDKISTSPTSTRVGLQRINAEVNSFTDVASSAINNSGSDVDYSILERAGNISLQAAEMQGRAADKMMEAAKRMDKGYVGYGFFGSKNSNEAK